METNRSERVFPVEEAGSLESRFRRWLQNPKKVLSPYIRTGMNILDIGCGPGFFTIEMAQLTGPTGHVTAADLQQGMLDKILKKIKDSNLSDRITLHLCRKDYIGLTGKFDLIFAFYVVHEVPDPSSFLRELITALKPGGKLLIVEPRFHVSAEAFDKTIEILAKYNLTMLKRRSTIMNREVMATLEY
jgi:ubiquinone/menaquinone biosynthesis C-methylase UbiE